MNELNAKEIETVSGGLPVLALPLVAFHLPKVKTEKSEAPKSE